MNTPPSSNGSVNDQIQAPTSAVMDGRQAIDALQEALQLPGQEDVPPVDDQIIPSSPGTPTGVLPDAQLIVMRMLASKLTDH